RPGGQQQFTFIGDPAGDIESQLNLPGEERLFNALVKHGEWFTPSGLPVRLSPLPCVNEIEPNEGSKEATPEQAPGVPVAFHGILSKNEDKDWFRFQGKKGQKLRAQVHARSLRSPLDAYIIVRKQGASSQIGNNDDAEGGSPDSRLDFEIPEDGIYNINIRDQLYGSGPDYTYRIEIVERGPSLSASLPYAERNNSQKWKMINVPRGNRVGRVLNLGRSNIGCDLQLEAPHLPSGLTIDSDPAPRSLSSMPVIFEAAEDAEIAGGLYRLKVKDPESGLTGPWSETINHIEVNNAGTFHSYSDERLAIAVIEEAPFHLDLQVPPVP
ncbi:MAG: hypothetical protein GWO24_00040, partial [Akkermansiaceae bacterium]|nr:hypothetical protein [Akkermansiaceae bacterium]